MSDDDVILKDETLLALYTKFRETRRSLGDIYPPARYDDSIARGRYHGNALPAPMVAQEHLFEFANTINRFCYDLHSIAAWRKVLESITEAEKMQALFEFVFHLASNSLSTPYYIKQRFITSVYQISYHTNRFCDSEWNEGSFNKHIKLSDAERSAKHFSTWSSLSAALSALNDDNFITASDNYRNRFHHGFPTRIGLGHIITVQQESPGSASYVVRNLPPLLIGDLLLVLEGQYDAALRSYTAYLELIKEQEKLWPKP